MFALVDRERPEWSALTSYFLTKEEAEEERSRRTRHHKGGLVLTGEEYLDIVEVERESRPCVFCGSQVEAENPEVDFCRMCFYVGRMHEERTCKEVLDAIRTLAGVEDASVWHTGGGCFLLGIKLMDGRLLTPSIGYMEDGRVSPDAGLPEDEGDRWAMVISESVEAFDEYQDDKVELVQQLFTNEELVEKVKEVIAQ